MKFFKFSQVSGDGKAYAEFVRTRDLSAGVYRLPRGGTDPQQPHEEDEIYYVAAGQARFKGGNLDLPVAAGAVLFVPAKEEHRFYDIGEDLEVLVFFGPAEGSRG
jgi:mannose-6-phosphate isomerase-like protein (cupin superfamily)